MSNLGSNFYPKLVQISSEIGMKPEDLIVVMISESGMNPSAVENKFKASGLIGFMPNTLKGLGFNGTWEDFIKLSGEEQLDYVKKMVNSTMKLNGGSFASAAQYYTAILFPAALKLPGIRQQDPSTPILEANPKTAGPNNKFSKKYFDIGYKITASFESKAYHANPLFDKDHKGMITYGDMIRQVEINKRNPIYQKTLAEMTNKTGYKARQPKSLDHEKTLMPIHDDIFSRYLSRINKSKTDIYDQLSGKNKMTSDNKSSLPQINDVVNNYLHMVAANDKKMYKLLPNNYAVIKIASIDYTDSIEFANILCSVLNEELTANAFTHTDGKSVEIECAIPGPEQICFTVLQELTELTTNAFKKATSKVGGIAIKTKLIANKKSYNEPLTLKVAETQHRKFLLKFI